ncbi:nitrilase-related carbon-nitrogen hydrolase [Mycetocola reblochoni]|nr:nitrilase-related carbon-nitrogen hydrolase [Mycetocola reblochoni]RLP70097.1 hydrolase [Mycetocola reblochoni]
MTDTSPLRVAAVQFAPGPDAARNAAAVRHTVASAAADGVQLLVFPEYTSVFDGAPSAAAVAAAQPLDGPFLDEVRSVAAAEGVAVVLGLVESVEGGERFANTLVGIAADGSIGAVYRKVHLYDAFGAAESRFVRPGEPGAPAVFSVSGIVVGLQTCYDLRFPESSRVLIDAGAELLVVPAQWVPGPAKESHWSTLLAARAIENTAYVLAADHPAPHGVGLSALYGPDGVLLAGAGAAEAVVSGVVEPDELARVRAVNPALGSRRYRVVV